MSPDVLKKERNRRKDVFHAAYHELAYLHPNNFTPNKKILNGLNIKNDEFFSIIRLSALTAHHDIMKKGYHKNRPYKLLNY